MKKKSVSVLSNVCPSCHEGTVFKYFWFIEPKCSHCGLSYEKEEGYYFGPMIISYFLTLLAALPIMLWVMFKEGVDQGFGMFAVFAFVCIIGPIFYRYSKLIWLHIETGFGRKMQAEQDRAQKISESRSQAANDTHHQG